MYQINCTEILSHSILCKGKTLPQNTCPYSIVSPAAVHIIPPATASWPLSKSNNLFF